MKDNPYEGRLIRLRAREPEEEPLLHRWFNDPEVTEFLSIRYPLSHQQERDFLARVSTISFDHASFSIVTKDDGRLIGGCGFERTSPENRSAILGIAIGDKTCWNGGYGTDAMRTLCRFGFEHMNLHRIELDVYAGNERALHVYEKVGFRVEGRRRDALFKYGRYHDIVAMGLLEGELVLAE